MSGVTGVQRAEIRRLAVALLPPTKSGIQQWGLGTMGELSSYKTRLADGRYVNIARGAIGTHVEISRGFSHVTVWFPRDRELRSLRRLVSKQVRSQLRANRLVQAQEKSLEDHSQEKTARDILGC
ncbi:MAG: hypothetical protein ACP5OR_09200 [Candidatus Dormibacteria bacterium]